jgi:hypothetical protein
MRVPWDSEGHTSSGVTTFGQPLGLTKRPGINRRVYRFAGLPHRLLQNDSLSLMY